MKQKQHYYLVPLAVLITALAGSFITQHGLEWYGTLHLPSFTPPAKVIGLVWTLIFIMLAVSAVLALMSEEETKAQGSLMWLFVLNTVLNVGWSYVFFQMHDISLAVWEAALLAVSVLVLIIVTKPLSKTSAWLLVPYLAWTLFATYLTYTIATMNPYWA